MTKRFLNRAGIIFIGAVLVLAAVFYFSLPKKENSVVGFNQKEAGAIQKICQSDNFKFAMTSDNHTSSAGLSPTFIKILNEVDKKDYLFVVDAGDLTSDGTPLTYQVFYGAIAKEKIPFFTAIGNHDIAGSGRDIFSKTFGDFYYSFPCKNSLFIILDDSNATGLDSGQMAWLESQLKKDFKHKFVFMHVPPFDPRQDWRHSLSNPVQAGALENLLAKYKPDLVFTGHIHAYYDVFKEGVEYVIDGGGGGGLVGNSPEHDFHSYMEISVTENAVTKKVIKIQ